MRISEERKTLFRLTLPDFSSTATLPSILRSPMMKRYDRNIISRAPSSSRRRQEPAGWSYLTIVSFHALSILRLFKKQFCSILAIRRRRSGEADISIDRRQPVSQVHVDQTTASAIARVHRRLPASDVPKLLERRFLIINLWRPIASPAIDWPLTLCDYRSVDREGETLGIKYNENHKWKYLEGMKPEEFVVIKW